ncbi:hypothetical protein OH77DRAFT_1423786 [Trametes cingulata]|nr:hypothetical protein OH77DRAFT_1423786 [Trametes cingulata]
MEVHKRKRDDDGTVVTFYAPDRTFQRVYKGQSLEETKSLVRKKLGLREDASLHFSRLYEGRHIDLEDEDDFEAFRHQARYVSSLDVSVFVGNAGPPLFTHRSSGEAAMSLPVSQKRKKRQRADPRTPVTLSEPASGRSTPPSVPSVQRPTSTLDANGVPKKKRKRKDESSLTALEASAMQPPALAGEGSVRQEESSPPEIADVTSMPSNKSHKTSKPTSNGLAETAEPTVASGTKRKRHESPEASVASSSRSPAPVTLVRAPAPASPPPSSPARKKRKKEKRPKVPEAAPATSETLAVPLVKADKKSKRRADASADPEHQSPPVADASEPPEGVAADVEDNTVPDEPTKKVKEKKEKKKKGRSHDASEVALEPPAPPEKSSKKKRKQRDAEESVETGSVASVDVPLAEPTAESSKRAGAAHKEKKSKSKGQAPSAESAGPVVVDALDKGDTSSRSDPGKRKDKRKDKRAGSVEAQADPSRSVLLDEVPASEEPVPGPSSTPAASRATAPPSKEKKRKRRKTLAADTSVDPDVSVASAASAPDVTTTLADEPAPPVVEESSTSQKKRSKKKSIAPSPPQEPASSSDAALAAVQDAVRAVLARSKPPAPAAPAPSEPAQPPPEPVLPGRKRKAGKSKLRQAWGPEDIEADEQPSTSATVPTAESSSVQPAENAVTAPTASADAAQPASKPAQGKKGRPSSAPPCPICDKVAVHARSVCPVVQGGPEAIRERISQLKKAGHDEELIDELEVLLKEANRRRKSAGAGGPSKIPAPIETSVLPADSEETTPSPVFPLSAANFGPTPSARPAPLPRVPAGSEISEVAVESKDEGSSNESSSDTDSDDEDEGDAKGSKPTSASFALGSTTGVDLASVDLEALLRGPVKPRGSILNQIPSESTSEGEGQSTDEDAQPDEDVDLSEEDKNDRAFRRLSRKLDRAASSSDDEREPEPEMGNADMDVDASDAVVPPTFMDVDPNDTVEQGPEVEASTAPEEVAPEDSSAEDESSEQPAEDQSAVGASKATTDQGYESDAEETAAPQLTTREASQSSDASEPTSDSASEAGQDVPSADRGDDSRVERVADVDGPVPSQESPEEPDEEAKAAQPEPEAEAGAAEGESSEDQAAEQVAAEPREDAAEEPEGEEVHSEKDASDAEEDAAPTSSPARELSPELGEEPQPPREEEAEEKEESERSPSPPPLRQPEPVASEDVDMPVATSTGQASSLDLHPDGDPSDPIESLGSFADVPERRHALEDDPIEDADEHEHEHEQPQPQDRGVTRLVEDGTPPPASQRTPGTVSRMKDRYGRLSHGPSAANGREKLASLSEQMLGSLLPSQLELDVEMRAEDGEQDGATDQEDDHEHQAQGGIEAQSEADKSEARGAPSQSTQDEDAEQEDLVETETRPRRTTRITTRRASAMPRSSSVPEPPASTPTPAPMPPPTAPAATTVPKRRGRLTAEEKAAREAEKKAERERKAAEKKAEREAKAAEKKAEKEARDAAKRAEKEAKEAEKRAEKEASKRGRGGATRGRGAAAKPVSTRSRAAASAEVEEEQEDGPTEQQQAPEGPADGPIPETPGFSKVSWTTLPSTQPRTQSESHADSSMVDELQPSSPDRSLHRPTDSPEPISHNTTTTEKEEADVSREVTITQDRSADQGQGDEDKEGDVPAATPRPNGREKEPLFIPSSSQYPNTPFDLPEGGLPESTPYANGKGHDESENEEVDAADADDVFEVPKRRPRAAWMADAPYRRLSDIATQQLFTPSSQIPSPALFPASQSQTRPSQGGFGRHEDDDDDDDDDESDDGASSGSDSEAGAKKSHIPQDRRAGAGVQQRKKSGLLSFGS